MKPTDLTGDAFNLPIFVPYGDVQYLAGNASFHDIDINANVNVIINSIIIICIIIIIISSPQSSLPG